MRALYSRIVEREKNNIDAMYSLDKSLLYKFILLTENHECQLFFFFLLFFDRSLSFEFGVTI